MKKKTAPPDIEPVLPILDDVVVPGDTKIEADLEIPELTAEVEIPGSEIEEEIPELTQQIPTQQGFSSEEILGYIDYLQSELEKNIRSTLMRTVVSIETEVKKTMAQQFDSLRKEIEKSKKNQ